MHEKDRANLLAVLDAIHAIQVYIHGITTPQGFHEVRMVFDATLMNFVVIGEMVDRITEKTRARAPGLNWQKIKDFRNFVAHDYLGVDAEEVWQIIVRDLPGLESEVRRLLGPGQRSESDASPHA